MNTFLAIILILFACNMPSTFASGSYAQIVESKAKLYKTPSLENSTKNVICELQITYFVDILLPYDEIFYKVNYNGVTGYVKKDALKRVNEVPDNPYPKAEMLTINNNVYLRSTPEKRENNNLVIIPANSNKLNYIGVCYGEQLDDFRENIWYYVEYLGTFGYVYGEYIYSMTNINPNIDQVSFVENPEIYDTINPLSNATCTLIIVLLLLPTCIIIALVYKKPSSKKYKEKVVLVKEYDDKL